MTNQLYRQIQASGDWFRQDGGGPVYLQVIELHDGSFVPRFTYDGEHWFYVGSGAADQGTAQTNLNNYVTKLNAGTA